MYDDLYEVRHRVSGELVRPGDMIRDFREETWEYRGLLRPPGGGSSGKVQVSSETGQHREFFPNVFDLDILEKR